MKRFCKAMGLVVLTTLIVYELEELLPPTEGPWTPVPEVVDFATKCAREAARFTTVLYLTAWDS